MKSDEQKGADFWEHPEQVKRFSQKPPDHRLAELVNKFLSPQRTRVLDLGCAGGRNTAFLLERSFDVWATDNSKAMIRETRRRARPYLADKTAERIRVRRMQDLSVFKDGFFDLIVALGILHLAKNENEFATVLAELGRILKEQGLLLVSNFSRGHAPMGVTPVKVRDSKFVYSGFNGGNLCLLTERQLDKEFYKKGFEPVEKTYTVRKESEEGKRVTVNALYKKVKGQNDEDQNQ
jgi:SAM-dependent methyltransferase